MSSKKKSVERGAPKEEWEELCPDNSPVVKKKLGVAVKRSADASSIKNREEKQLGGEKSHSPKYLKRLKEAHKMTADYK